MVHGIEIIDTSTMAWETGRGPDSDDPLDYLYHKKIFRFDPETGQRGALFKVEPGYADSSSFHDSAEECLFLHGECYLSGEGHFVEQDYFWRPPGYVHAVHTTEGFEAILYSEGRSEAEDSGPHTRIRRPDEEAGRNAIHVDHLRSIGPRGWIKRLPTSLLPWQPGTRYALGEGPLVDFAPEQFEVKRLSTNVLTGAHTALLRLAPGYAQVAPGAHSAGTQFFVVSGELALGTVELGAGAFLYRPGGVASERLSSDRGAVLFMKCDGPLDFILAK